MGNANSDAAAEAFNVVVDTQYLPMVAQRAAMLSGVKLDLGIIPSGEQFSGAQAVAGMSQDRSDITR